MQINKKQVRYAYWLFLAFVKKNAQSIVLSFLISLLGIIALVSFSPYILKFLTSKTETIGITGTFSIDTLPVEVVSKFSNGLLHVNDKGELIPLLVDSWEPVDGGREYRFHIKKDLTWNDGSPFTAKDIKYSFKDIKTEAENDYLLIFKLPKPLPIFPNFLSKPVLKYPLIGVAGLYKVEKIKFNAGYITELQLTPQQDNLPILIYKFYDTDSKLIEAYKLGEITEMSTTKLNVANQFKEWKNTQIEREVDYSKVMTLFFNLNDPLLKDEKDLRHAIAESINKDIYKDLGVQANSPIPPTSWAYNPDIKPYQYNPTASQKVIERYTEASDAAHLKISTYYDYLSIADDMKNNLASAGLNIKVEVLTGNLPPDYSLLLAQMTLSKDPDQYFFWHSTQAPTNITSYKNVRVDKALEDGRATFNIKNRKEIYADFQKVIVEDMPAYFMFYPYTYTIKRK
jgi:peptide/nickel transport system substrate-binding protein